MLITIIFYVTFLSPALYDELQVRKQQYAISFSQLLFMFVWVFSTSLCLQHKYGTILTEASTTLWHPHSILIIFPFLLNGATSKFHLMYLILSLPSLDLPCIVKIYISAIFIPFCYPLVLPCFDFQHLYLGPHSPKIFEPYNVGGFRGMH